MQNTNSGLFVPPPIKNFLSWILCRTISDPSALLLVTINIIFVIVAIIKHWTFSQIVWSYWMQSVIIGNIQFYKNPQFKITYSPTILL